MTNIFLVPIRDNVFKNKTEFLPQRAQGESPGDALQLHPAWNRPPLSGNLPGQQPTDMAPLALATPTTSTAPCLI